MNRRRWLIVFAGVAVVLVVVLVAALLTGLSREDERAATPEDAVRTYLTALADADAATALAVIEPRPEPTFLTDEVLRAQRAAAPMSEIRIGSDASGGSDGASDTTGRTEISASYRMGGRVADTAVRVARVADGWAVVDGAVAVRIDALQVVRPTLFGREVRQGDTVHLFPGPQRWGSADTDFVGRVAEDAYPIEPQGPVSVRVTGELSPSGTSAVSDAVSEHLRRCANSTRIDPAAEVAGCTQRLFRSAVPGSVRWTAPRDLSGLRYLLRSPRTSPGETSTERAATDLGTVDVVGPVRWRVAYTPSYDDDGPRVETIDEQYLIGSVDLTADRPQFIADAG
ncbi:hypothetical protein [Gordonia sp. 'Campus']|uniref:hypothetical protein n=1 Tax=Gordonia sp. 'Campus' TaxID=2915824 RepID=UPI001EE3C12D|nr:hypothetical protein [Gordonia sp. 'Campus']